MAVLVLFLPADPAERAARYVIVQEGVSIASGTVRPGEEPASPAGVRLDRALVLLPSEQVFLRRVAVPGASERDARRAAPFLVEDQLAQPLEDVAVEIGPRGADGLRVLTAAARTDLERWKRFVSGLGVKPVHALPDALALTLRDADLAVARLGERVLFLAREGVPGHEPSGGEGSRDPSAAVAELIAGALELDLAPLVLPALAARLRPSRILLADGTDPALVSAPGLSVTLARAPEPDLALAVAALSPAALAALPALVGAGHAAGIDWPGLLKPWRTAAALALTAALGAAGLAVGEAIWFEQRTDAYRRAEVREFQQAFPEITRVVNARAQLRQQLAALGAGDGPGAFLELASALSDIVAQTEGVEVDAIRYDTSRGGLSVSARYRDFGDFEALQRAAEARGVAVDDGGARQTDQGVAGDFIVRLP